MTSEYLQKLQKISLKNCALRYFLFVDDFNFDTADLKYGVMYGDISVKLNDNSGIPTAYGVIS